MKMRMCFVTSYYLADGVRGKGIHTVVSVGGGVEAGDPFVVLCFEAYVGDFGEEGLGDQEVSALRKDFVIIVEMD